MSLCQEWPSGNLCAMSVVSNSSAGSESDDVRGHFCRRGKGLTREGLRDQRLLGATRSARSHSQAPLDFIMRDALAAIELREAFLDFGEISTSA